MSEISDEEKDDLREILRNFYGDQVAAWNINQKSFELFGELIRKTKQCDQAMKFVPLPYGGGNPVNWSIKQVRKIITRHFLKPSNKHYIICMKFSAISMKTQFILAQS